MSRPIRRALSGAARSEAESGGVEGLAEAPLVLGEVLQP